MSPNTPEPPAPILRPKMPELDTIRGLAILGVFLYHALYCQPDLASWSQPSRLLLTAMWPGQKGVNLFFVLSGFLITGILMESRSRPRYYARFYKRRALRILPVYLVMVVILGITKFAAPSFLVLSLLYLSNVTPLFGIPIGYPVLWSLAVEEHFYLLWPLICRNFSAKKLMMVCAGIILLSPASRYVSFLFTPRSGEDFHIYEYTWNSLDGLACGALLVLILRQAQVTRRQLAGSCSALLLGGLVLMCITIPAGILSIQRPVGVAFQPTLLNFCFTGLLGLFLAAGSGEYAKLVHIKFLQFLGYISYGLYLFHDFVLRLYDRIVAREWHYVQSTNDIGHLLARTLVAGAVAVMAAYVSRKYFEDRFLRLKD
ncbi:MAG TPA: acyltransferase [Candidatus Sulfotelmatobacter sp.]|nr:acyltransferase [Candidatus Sulfotelmatobacter sp.]